MAIIAGIPHFQTYHFQKITSFNGKIHYTWSFSIAILTLPEGITYQNPHFWWGSLSPWWSFVTGREVLLPLPPGNPGRSTLSHVLILGHSIGISCLHHSTCTHFLYSNLYIHISSNIHTIYIYTLYIYIHTIYIHYIYTYIIYYIYIYTLYTIYIYILYILYIYILYIYYIYILYIYILYIYILYIYYIYIYIYVHVYKSSNLYNSQHPRCPSQVLKGINFKISSGQSVGLVGPSGGGKSTVMSLLQRFYDPQEGSVPRLSVDGSWVALGVKCCVLRVGFHTRKIFDPLVMLWLYG